jgi:formate dehydrogenase iron-sulfur subunit
MKAILYDINLCIGCEACVDACKEVNGLPAEPRDRLSSTSFTYLTDVGDDVYYRHMCMHCVEPSCASACPVGALQKTDVGPVTYDYDKCIGCRYCMVACPFSVPRYEWESNTPRVRKCEMCKQRTLEGGITACAEVCPTEATTFGDRDELIATAWKRISGDPDSYAHRVFGAEEVGGTCVLMIGPEKVLEAAFPLNLPNEALPELTWRVMERIPAAVGVAGVSLLGINWLIRRRMALASENGTATVDSAATDKLGHEEDLR